MQLCAAPDGASIRIGISSCLLGHAVRYDGGHKRDGFLADTFGRYVQWVPVCPEVELGLGVPRPTLRLERDGDGARLAMPSTGSDYTDAMRRYAEKRLGTLAAEDLCGYVLKKDSPSCGMEQVAVYGGRRVPSKSGVGLFAEALLRRFPNLPIEEEGRLYDPRRRDNFVERVCAYRRLRSLFAARWSVGDLAAFHAAHELQLVAHSPTAYERLSRLVARAKTTPRAALRERYEAEFMGALKAVATPRRRAKSSPHFSPWEREGDWKRRR